MQIEKKRGAKSKGSVGEDSNRRGTNCKTEVGCTKLLAKRPGMFSKFEF